MFLWQGDWKEFEFNRLKKRIVAFLDDSSQLIPCYGIIDYPTTKNTVAVLKQKFHEYGTPREILIDYDTQFVFVWDSDLPVFLSRISSTRTTSITSLPV